MVGIQRDYARAASSEIIRVKSDMTSASKFRNAIPPSELRNAIPPLHTQTMKEAALRGCI